MYDDDLIRSSQ